VFGVDISADIIEQAEKNKRYKNTEFKKGDVKSLQFKDNSFDWIWSVDTVWPGPKEYGCPSEDPFKIVREFFRTIRPGGIVYLLFWSFQKILSGHPILEAKFNATSSAQVPFTEGVKPLFHTMNAASWLAKAGFSEITAHTYAGDIIAPLDENSVRALHYLFDMLWGKSETEVSPRDWKQFLIITSPDSPEYIFNNPHYYGFYTYTMFTGLKTADVPN
jgi:demethylmenaquinone methyltransferase/2-methoxy-6-polyprenyl-1,4-benzoquinol methylase